MTSIDDLPLDHEREVPGTLAPSAPSSPGPGVVIATLCLVAAIAGGVWYIAVGRRGVVPEAAPAAATGAPEAAAPSDSATPTPPLPPLAEMDAVVRQALTSLGGSPLLLAWLATDDLVAGIVTAVDRLAAGDSPARDLAVLRPAQAFATRRQAGVTSTDPASFARYAPLVQAVTTVSPDTLAALAVRWEPRLEEAYRLQGHPEGGFMNALRRAAEVVATTPDPRPDAALVPGLGGFAYADPALERLPAAQKHLMRMGPDHVRAVRDQARRFASALPPRP
jgi:hypothetical protein